MMNEKENQATGPLVGYRVLEFGSTIAGPFCARLMADFGAEVIKVEPLTGDPVRNMGRVEEDVSLYAASILRNKKLVSIDIKKPDGLELVRELMSKVDIVIENLRPGTLERLGLGYDELIKTNPGLVLVRISGYGQTGPNSSRPGYGVTSEAFAGVRHMTGEPDLPPSRVALAVTDHLTAVYAAYGAVMALLTREKTGKGQVVDAALYEAAFSMMEQHVPAYERLKVIPKRIGSKLLTTAPNSLYPTKDDEYVLIAANNDPIFRRLTEAMGQPELADDPKYSTQRPRAERRDELDDIITDWTEGLTGKEVEAKLLEASVPTSRVYTIEEIFNDEHFKAREQLLDIDHEKFGKLTVAGITPKLSEQAGNVYQLGGEIGRDTHEVLHEILEIDKARIAELESLEIIKSK